MRHPELLILLFPVFWSAVLLLLAHTGGWARLASRYRSWDDFEGRRWRFQSAQFGSTNYNSCLVIGTNERGLHFSVFFPFRPGHAPFLVPWEALSVIERKRFFRRYAEFTFRDEPGVTVRLPKQLGDKIQAEVGSRWPKPPEAI